MYVHILAIFSGVTHRWNRSGFLTTGTGTSLNRSDRIGPAGLSVWPVERQITDRTANSRSKVHKIDRWSAGRTADRPVADTGSIYGVTRGAPGGAQPHHRSFEAPPPNKVAPAKFHFEPHHHPVTVKILVTPLVVSGKVVLKILSRSWKRKRFLLSCRKILSKTKSDIIRTLTSRSPFFYAYTAVYKQHSWTYKT